jgi:hypothetical protein
LQEFADSLNTPVGAGKPAPTGFVLLRLRERRGLLGG